MNELYSVPVIVNAKLEFMKVPYIPTTIEMGKRNYVQLPVLLCVVREAKRRLAEDGHDNYTIKCADINPCVQ